MLRVTLGIALAASLVACGTPAPKARPDGLTTPTRKSGAVTLSIIGTNDLHGAIERLPRLAGYVANLRAARATDGGGVLLLDGGDMFQGTLESNLEEGASIVRAYNAMGYTAAAVGNHEFDFGPVGPKTTPTDIDDDARGALKARALEASFPFVVSNVIDVQSKSRIKWKNMPASIMVESAGLKIGIIGASTESTPFSTMPANFVGLAIRTPAEAVAEESARLKKEGAQLIVVTAHLGTKCKEFDKPSDSSSCDQNEELIKMIDGLPKGSVDVIIAGHTHAVVAHRIKDIAVIESYSSGRAFGRVDLRVAPDGHVTSVKVHPPQLLCAGDTEGNPMPVAQCAEAQYEGQPVVADAAIQKIVDEAVANAAQRRREKLGVTLSGIVEKSYELESSQGNWLTDLMLAAQPGSRVALTNGGGLRADIPAGELTYGALYEAIPFDNRFSFVTLKGSHIRGLISTNLQRGGAILSWGGLTAKARCKGDTLDVSIIVDGKPLDDKAEYKLVTSDFLASGGDGLIGRLKLPEGAITVTDTIIREALADLLRQSKVKVIDPAKLHSQTLRRMDYVGSRPVKCGKQGAKPIEEQPE